jgi:NADPH:quinone reductase-like Zn-dependent oxidoreductase
MRQVWITRPGPPEVLQVREAPDPVPLPGQIRIRVHAAGINFADLMARVGLYPDAPKIPCVVGYEVAGVVDAVGDGAEHFELGDRVFGMPHFGGYSDTVVLDEAQAFHMPARMPFDEAAALPVVYLTAHHMMLFTGNLRKGSRVLIHSAAGGVGLAAIELAKTRQCEIFGVASASKHDFLREMGCHHTLESGDGMVPAVRALTDGRGVDLVLDPVGGRSWSDGYELLAPAGRLVAFGLSAAASGKTRHVFHALLQVMRVRKWSPMKLMDDNKQVQGVNMGHLFGETAMLAEQFRTLVEMYEAGLIRPRVDRAFRFSEAPLAHHYIHERKSKGKVILVPDALFHDA